MEKIRRRLIIEDFVENTTFHGVFYTNTANRWSRLIWLLTVFISAALIVLSTVLMVNRYLKYESFIVTEESDLSRLESIPNLLVCESPTLSMVDSILKYEPGISESELINETFMQKMRQGVIESNRYSVVSCKITIKDQVINCSQYSQDILFTFNGFCLLMSFQEIKQNASLLDKETNLLNYFNRNEEVGIEVTINSLEQESDSLYFQLDAECPHDCSFKHFRNVLDDHDDDDEPSYIYYKVTPIYAEYSSSLNEKKCSHDTACLFKCLQRVIADQVKCYFTLDPIKSANNTEGLPYCSLSQLTHVEQITQEYSHNRSLCGDQCLPSCKSLLFETREMTMESDDKIEGFVFKFILEYKVKQIKHIELFGYTDLLNFMNGLWSILLGISVLSIWEIVEFIYALTMSRRTYFRKVKLPLSTNLQLKKVKSALQSAFYDTYLHGFKNLLNDHYSKSAKLRWAVLLLLATIGFTIAVNDAANEYLEYNSDIRRTFKQISKNDSLTKSRTISLQLCAPLVLVNETTRDIYMELNKKAEELFEGDRRDISHIIGEYRKYMKDKATLDEDDENITRLYDKVYSRIKLPSLVGDVQHSSLDYNFDKVCLLTHINETLEEWFTIGGSATAGIASFNLNESSLNENIFSILPVYQIDLFMVDTESFHISDKSWIISYSSLDRRFAYSVYAELKHKQLLESPFRPSCNPKKAYRQHECYQECFNEIILSVFGCKVIFGETSGYSNYCNPWMIPLIINYEKHVMKNSYTSKCDHCKEPCDLFYYELEVSKYGVIDFYIPTNYLHLKVDYELIVQKKILEFEDTLMVIISFCSLFYGASILAFIQILFNLTSSARPSNSETGTLFQQMPSLDLISNSTTLHCVKYISSKNRNGIMKLFWFTVLSVTILTGSVYCVQKMMDYQRSTPVTLLVELDDVEPPMIHVCEKIYRHKIFSEIEWFSSFSNLEDYLQFKEIEEFSSIKEYLTFYFDELKANLKLNNTDFKQLFEINISSLVNQSTYIHFDTFDISNGIKGTTNTSIKLTDYNFATNVYDTGLSYNYYRSIDICQTLNLSLFNYENKHIQNPFVSLLKNQLSFYHEEERYSAIYFEKNKLELYNELTRYLKIKSVIKNYDYTNDCMDKENCIANKQKQVLGSLSEHKLFFCNRELRDAVYTVFNCTPFMTQIKSSKPECSMAYALLIETIMETLKKTLFKCEFSSYLSSIEFDELELPETDIEGIIKVIDFNGVKVYEQKRVEKYDLLQLVIDLSNWLNLLIGFSIITVCEILFLYLKQKNCFTTRNKTATVIPK